MKRPIAFAIAGLMLSTAPVMAQHAAATPTAPTAVETGNTATPSVLATGPSSVAAPTATQAAPAEEGHAASGGHNTPELPKVDWSFNGPFGEYDKASLQRGFQVYRQVCSACHSMNLVHYRNLTALGYTEDQTKSIAGEYQVTDGPNDEGEMFERAARPSDKLKAPYENIQAAKYANNGALPPDLSLITKARAGGADYVHGILTGYEAPPAGTTLLQGQHWNKYMPGHIIAMAAPLSDGVVAYENADIPQTTDQYAKDVAHFLTWASEPELEVRKQTGIKAILFLAVFAGLMYAVKRKLWSKFH